MFEGSKNNGKKFGEICGKALTAISKFAIINCLLNPICSAGSFSAGFTEGFKKANK